MSSLADELLIELEPKMKKGMHENEDLDRLSDLPDCILLHVLSFLKTKQAVHTCILSTRWKHPWKRIPVLILNSFDFSNLKSFERFAYRIMSLHDHSIALSIFDFGRRGNTERRFLRKIARYISSRSAQLQRLEIYVRCDSSLILPSISSCRALTFLNLSVMPKGCHINGYTLFPNSLSLPALTTLQLNCFAFCATDNAGCAEPFSAFSRLNSLLIHFCTVKGAQILSISNATLVNLTMNYNHIDFNKKIELSAPSLSSFTFVGTPYHKLCGSTLSSVKQLSIDTYKAFGVHPVVLLSWLLDLSNIKSLTVTSSTLLVLSKVPDLFKVNFPSLCNLKSLKVKMDKAFEAGLEPSATIPILDGILAFLLQNSPSAEVDFITNWSLHTLNAA